MAIQPSSAHCAGVLYNERTGTPFNYLEVPTDIVLLVVLWRLRYKLSLRDVAEMFLERGFVFTHETVRDWEKHFAPLIADQLRIKRRGQAGGSVRTHRQQLAALLLVQPEVAMALQGWNERPPVNYILSLIQQKRHQAFGADVAGGSP